MAENSKIEWTKHTANLWHGCAKVSAGCDNCYAEVLSHRWGNDVWGNDKPRKLIGSFFRDLDKFQTLAEKANEMHRVFVGSMMDIFEKPMPLIDSKGNKWSGGDTGFLRARFFDAITQGDYNNLMFLFLTKRPSNINKYIPESWKINPPENVMFGTSPVNQETANILIKQLLEVKGKKFLSIEPMLSEISFRWAGWHDYKNKSTREIINGEPCLVKYEYDGFKGIDWVIVGGESGHHKRPFNCNWARTIRDQCKENNVPFFMKQIDKIQPIPEDLKIREFPQQH
jgi:protein gp37